MHSGCHRPILKSLQTYPLKRSTHSTRNRRINISPPLPSLRIAEDIVSDCGPQFISQVWHSFFQLLRISVSLSSGYHPQTNGQTERKIQEIWRYLRSYCHKHQHDWSCFLSWQYAHNSLRQTTTGLTLFQCVLGYQPPLFPWSGEPSDVLAVNYWFQKSKRVWDSAHVHLHDLCSLNLSYYILFL